MINTVLGRLYKRFRRTLWLLRGKFLNLLVPYQLGETANVEVNKLGDTGYYSVKINLKVPTISRPSSSKDGNTIYWMHHG